MAAQLARLSLNGKTLRAGLRKWMLRAHAGPEITVLPGPNRVDILTEWAEFEEHFDKRKVELGNCARPYATPCEHEHACIRCPMLHVSPGMIARLDEIHTDLLARRELAQTRGWLGELEGIDLTLQYLRDKRADAQITIRRGRIDLGLPAIQSAT